MDGIYSSLGERVRLLVMEKEHIAQGTSQGCQPHQKARPRMPLQMTTNRTGAISYEGIFSKLKSRVDRSSAFQGQF